MKEITVIITIDKMGGIAFGGKRQSRDRELAKDICLSTEGKIYMTEYSARLFGDYKERVEVSDAPLKKCPDGGTVFLECERLMPYAEYIKKLIVYNWNREYPADLYSDAKELTEAGKKHGGYDFAGFSHDKITKEIYEI